MGSHYGPSLFRIGKFWHYRFTRGGKRIQRSTKEIYQAKAEAVAWAAWDGDSLVPTLAELVESWEEIHELTHSAAYIRNVAAMRRWHLYGLGAKRIDRIRTEDVEEARNAHLQRYSAASTNLWIRMLRMVFHWAVKRGLIGSVPWRVPMIRLQKRSRAILPTAKASAWIEAVDQVAGPRWGLAAAIRLMLGLGLRESEALSARWEWLDLERGVYVPGKTKGKEADPIHVPQWLAEHLEPKRCPEGLIVASPRGGLYSPGSTRDVIRRASSETGIVGLTPHRLRGTFATLLSEAGVPIQDIQKAMRHKDSRTTMGYLETNIARVAKAQEEIAKRLGFTGRKIGEEENPKPQG